jgi:oligosaccharyltransferase complex subunit beta
LAKDVTAWTFQESNVFRIDKVEHHGLNATTSPDRYTVNDQIVRVYGISFSAADVFYKEFTAYISKYEPHTSTWVPHSGLQDLQLEFTMLDPHIRTALRPSSGSAGKYSVTFRAPDRHGVFKFVINYRRKG